MPRLGGVGLVERLRPEAPDVPVIFISGHPLGDSERLFQEKTVSAWLQKPFEIGRLADTVRQALAGNHSRGLSENKEPTAIAV
jgi:FixJ family two-component response regulator